MPYPENTPAPDELPGLSPQEIAGLPVELLAILQREIDERLKRDKAAKTRLDAALVQFVSAIHSQDFPAEPNQRIPTPGALKSTH